MKGTKLFLLMSLSAMVWLFTFCSKEKPIDLNSSSLDTYLYKESLKNTGYYQYNSDSMIKPTTEISVYESSTNSPHGKYFTMRLNTFTYKQLDTDSLNKRRPKFNTPFKDSSIFILDGFKDLSSTTNPEIKLVMMKLASSDKAYGGYVWAGYKKDGTIVFSSDDKGKACGQCHSKSSFDYVLTYD